MHPDTSFSCGPQVNVCFTFWCSPRCDQGTRVRTPITVHQKEREDRSSVQVEELSPNSNVNLWNPPFSCFKRGPTRGLSWDLPTRKANTKKTRHFHSSRFWRKVSSLSLGLASKTGSFAHRDFRKRQIYMSSPLKISPPNPTTKPVISKHVGINKSHMNLFCWILSRKPPDGFLNYSC